MRSDGHPRSADSHTVRFGFDIGGSKTHAVRTEDGRVVAETIVGSANVSSMGVAEAGRQLEIAIARLGGPHRVQSAMAGSAGVDTPASKQRLEELLGERIPGAVIGVVHDTQLILAAAGLDEGIALISGTGAVAWGRWAGRTMRAGGWGHLLGDEGSGYWVVREVVRQALRDNDTGRPMAPLTKRLAQACQVDTALDLHDLFYTRADRQYWSRRSEVVFSLAGDDRADAIIEEAARALADVIVTVADGLGTTGPVVLGGGQVVHQPLLQRRIRDLIAPRGITDIRVLDVDPVYGALRLAQSWWPSGEGT